MQSNIACPEKCHAAATQVFLEGPEIICNYLGESGAAMRSRTSNLLIRSQMLYPIELWLLVEAKDKNRQILIESQLGFLKKNFVGSCFVTGLRL